MGLGDDLMAAGEARTLHRSARQLVIVLAPTGRPVRSPVFDGNPYIVDRPNGRQVVHLVNGPGKRGYILAKTPEKWTWRKYAPTPAEVFFTPDELAEAEQFRGMVMVEPHIKAIGHTNKRWPWDRWQGVVDALPEVRFLQCGPAGTRALNGVRFNATLSFRQALAALSVCRAYVGPEGGLHHGAAAVGTPAVVLFGGFISPQCTGYPQHRNLFTGSGLGCGMRVDCQHCRAAMDKITIQTVVDNLKEIL